MTELFGINIAALVDQSIQSAGGLKTGTLIRATPGTRTAGNLTGGNNPTSTSYTVRGFVENKTERRRAGDLATVGGEQISILGNSLPGDVEPRANDQVIFEGLTYTVTAITERDPARALFVLAVTR